MLAVSHRGTFPRTWRHGGRRNLIKNARACVRMSHAVAETSLTWRSPLFTEKIFSWCCTYTEVLSYNTRRNMCYRNIERNTHFGCCVLLWTKQRQKLWNWKPKHVLSFSFWMKEMNETCKQLAFEILFNKLDELFPWWIPQRALKGINFYFGSFKGYLDANAFPTFTTLSSLLPINHTFSFRRIATNKPATARSVAYIHLIHIIITSGLHALPTST